MNGLGTKLALRSKVLGLAALAAALGGTGALGQAGGTIEGTLFAPKGSSVAGAHVVACWRSGDGCDEERSVSVEVKGGASGAFKIAGLGEGPYAIVAFKDLDGNEELGDGDLLSIYTRAGQSGPATVKPPVKGIELRLSVSGAPSEPAEETQETKAPAEPAKASAPAKSSAPAASSLPTKGALSGRVVDLKGRPMAGIRVEASGRGSHANGMPAYETLVATTDKNGRYTLALTGNRDAGTSCGVTYSASLGMYTDASSCRSTAGSAWKWEAMGYVNVPYNGRAYCLPMDGTSWDPFTSLGATRDFFFPKQAYGQLIPTLWVEGLSARAEYTVKLKLTPQGTLWNGQRGTTREITWKSYKVDRGAALYSWQRDIPLGRYTVTAVLVEQNGTERAIGLARVTDRAGGNPWNEKTGAYGKSLTLDFEQSECDEQPLASISLKAR